MITFDVLNGSRFVVDTTFCDAVDVLPHDTVFLKFNNHAIAINVRMFDKNGNEVVDEKLKQIHGIRRYNKSIKIDYVTNIITANGVLGMLDQMLLHYNIK